MNFESIEQLYKKHNEEEIEALNYLKSHNSYYTFEPKNDLASAKLYLKNEMIVTHKHPRFCYVSAHHHDYIELNYVLSGKVTQILDDKKIILKQGELLLLSRESKHEIMPCGENDILINFIIMPTFFDFTNNLIKEEQFMNNFFPSLLSKNKKVDSIVIHASENSSIQNIMKNILINFEKKDTLSKQLTKQYFTALVFEIFSDKTVDKEVLPINNEAVLLFEIKNYIENNYSKPSLQELAELLNEDYFYLSKHIKKVTNNTFKKLVEEYRINIAKILLTKTSNSVEDIAYNVGYNNQTFFYSLFKKYENCTPNEYRQNQKLSI